MTSNPVTPAVEPQELLQRVASSAQFQRSKRLRELLLYLGDRALKDPNCTLREQEVGVDVLGRPSDYDTSHDTLVRVLVSQLRKRLQEYFATEGKDEPLIVEIPKGTYLPVFRPRGHESFVTTETVPALTPLLLPRKRRFVAGGVAAVAVLAILIWTAVFAASLVSRRSSRPTVEALWTQLFGNRQSTYLVLSDVSLMEFENIMGRFIPLSEYEAHEFQSLAIANIPDPTRRALALGFVSRITTAMSDVQASRDFGVIASQRGLPLTVINSRDMSSSIVSSMNTILLGSWRSNPWIGLFEDQLNFHTEYQESPPAARFINRQPHPGEPPAYAAEWRRTGYCRVAFLPNPRRTGNVLLISGTDVISTEAGARFIASEDLLTNFRRKLGLRPGAPLPNFELLFRTQIVNSTVPWFEIVAYRTH